VSAGPRLGRQEAERVAAFLTQLVKPVSESVLVVGSLRRGAATVGDVELVIVPTVERTPLARDAEQLDLFGTAAPKPQEYTESVPLLGFLDGISRLTDPRAGGSPVQFYEGAAGPFHATLTRGPQWGRVYRKVNVTLWEAGHLDFPVDLFLASPANVGWVTVLRTGPKDWNLWLLHGMKSRDLRSQDGFIWAGDRRLDTPTEDSVFSLLGLTYVQPEDRSVVDGEDEAARTRRWWRLSHGG